MDLAVEAVAEVDVAAIGAEVLVALKWISMWKLWMKSRSLLL